MAKVRKTQAERREETHAKVLASAIKLFGRKGYTGTSLDDVAKDSGLTTRPIYHYFGNKEGLFRAALEASEAKILEYMEASPGESVVNSWGHFLDLCKDPGFRRIVFVDGPNVLGRARWADSAVSQSARAQSSMRRAGNKASQFRSQLRSRMFMAAMAEAAMAVAEADDQALARKESEALIKAMFGA